MINPTPHFACTPTYSFSAFYFTRDNISLNLVGSRQELDEQITSYQYPDEVISRWLFPFSYFNFYNFLVLGYIYFLQIVP